MKRIIAFTWITLLSGFARSADWGFSTNGLSGTDQAPKTFVGNGTGTCASPSIFQAAVNSIEGRNLNEIRNLMRHARSEAERKMVLDKVLEIIGAEEK